MKTFLKLCLCLGIFFMATPIFAQVPTPTGIDYCTCLDGVQAITDDCPCDDTGGNHTTTNNNNNNSEGTPTASGDGSTGGAIPTGAFPMVIAWLECFFDPDCN